MDRAMNIHHSILEEAGASVSLGMGGLARSSDHDGMLLLTENEADLVHAANAVPMQGFDDEYLSRLSTGSASGSSLQITPIRTGKRGRPPGSTTGSAAKRMAQQSEQVVLLTRAVYEMQKQVRELREALATVVETQTNQSAILAVLGGSEAAVKALKLNMQNDDHHSASDAAYRQMLA